MNGLAVGTFCFVSNVCVVAVSLVLAYRFLVKQRAKAGRVKRELSRRVAQHQQQAARLSQHAGGHLPKVLTDFGTVLIQNPIPYTTDTHETFRYVPFSPGVRGASPQNAGEASQGATRGRR